MGTVQADFEIYKGPIGETLSEEGANRLAQVIRKYWYSRGFNGAIVRVLARESGDGRRRIMGWDVRSNLVNGVPPRSYRLGS